MTRVSPCLVLLAALLACKQSNEGSSSSAPSSGPDTAVAAGVGVAGTLAGAESDAKDRASKGGATLVSAQLSGITQLCVAIAWQVPTKNRRALFLTVTGPISSTRSERIEPGPTGGLCLDKVVAGTYTLALSHGPSMAEAASDRLAPLVVTVN